MSRNDFTIDWNPKEKPWDDRTVAIVKIGTNETVLLANREVIKQYPSTISEIVELDMC